jgi:hypothetical protein
VIDRAIEGRYLWTTATVAATAAVNTITVNTTVPGDLRARGASMIIRSVAMSAAK